jgi:hypothetical protein
MPVKNSPETAIDGWILPENTKDRLEPIAKYQGWSDLTTKYQGWLDLTTKLQGQLDLDNQQQSRGP